MSKEYTIKPHTIRLLVALNRLLHLLLFLIIASIIVLLIIYFIKKTGFENRDWGIFANMLQILEYGTITTFAILAFKNILSGNADNLLKYIFTDDITEEHISKISWIFNSRKDKQKQLANFINGKVKHRYALRISIYFIIICLAGWVAYITFKKAKESNISLRTPSNNYYFMRNHQSNLPIVGNSGDFKLIFSFEHRKTNIDTFGKDESETLENLLRSLRGCLESPQDSIELKVIGFASEYQNDQQKKFEDINLANERANIVADKINMFKTERKALLPHLLRISIKVHQWKLDEYDDMVKARIFKEVTLDNVTEKQQQEETSEYLNRRAEVTITKAGACSN